MNSRVDFVSPWSSAHLDIHIYIYTDAVLFIWQIYSWIMIHPAFFFFFFIVVTKHSDWKRSPKNVLNVSGDGTEVVFHNMHYQQASFFEKQSETVNTNEYEKSSKKNLLVLIGAFLTLFYQGWWLYATWPRHRSQTPSDWRWSDTCAQCSVLMGAGGCKWTCVT